MYALELWALSMALRSKLLTSYVYQNHYVGLFSVASGIGITAILFDMTHFVAILATRIIPWPCSERSSWTISLQNWYCGGYMRFVIFSGLLRLVSRLLLSVNYIIM